MHSAGDIAMDVCIIGTELASGPVISSNERTLSMAHESMSTERGTTSAVTHQTSQHRSFRLFNSTPSVCAGIWVVERS